MIDTPQPSEAAPPVHALGFSSNSFDVRSPGRLCRGRERWIEPWEDDAAAKTEVPEEEGSAVEAPQVQRIVLTGAVFSDDSAADARRGLPFSKVDIASIVAALFPRKGLLAFMEDGHPADIPSEAEGIEAYVGYRAGGREQLGLVRWRKEISGVQAIRAIIGKDGPPDERVRGFAVLDAGTDVEALSERLFAFVGFSTLDSPPAHYQPGALPSVLEHTRAVIVVHRDKHGPALGIYAREGIPRLAERLERLCEPKGTLLVPFAIPPMLARWDRALSELRTEWMATRSEDFPVPPSPNPPRERRRDRRGRRNKAPVPAPAPVAEE